MALPQEGLLTLQQVNIELSKEPEAHITMNDSDVRALAKRPVNESSISFDDLKGRTTGIAEYTIRRGHVDEDLIRMVNRELGDLSKVHIIFEDGITVVNQVFFDQSIAKDITKGPYKMSGNTITDLSRFFRGCENMTEIGPELFYGLPKLKFIGSIFMNCPIKQYHSAMFKFNPELKELPPGVLDDNVIVPVDVFEGSAIEVISGNVRNESLDILNPIKNTIREINASIFQGQTIDPTMFADCINLFSVMKLSGNFEDRKGAYTTGFAGGAWLKADTFKDLLKLNTISSLNVRGYDVGFLNNLPGLLNVHNIDAQQVPIVGRIFDTCPNLNNITKLFGNANVEYTNRTLVSVDEHIFDNCPNILICSEAFANCVNFTGKVPELWKRSNAPSIIHYDYAKGTINASNYIEIPPDWGGGELPKEQTFTSKEDFDNRIQNLIASGKMKEMSFTFDGDFTQEPNLIRFPVETTETPKMIKTTHKITVNSKEYYYLNIDSMFEDCVNLKYINPSLFSTNEYGKYQFIKTARKTFKNACVDGTEFPTGIFNVVEGLYDVSECFMNSKCTFGTSGPFKEKHHLMKCVSTFENSKITDNLAVFWQGIDGHFQGELEYPQRDLTRMYANTRLIAPYALWNGSFINVQGGITYPVICDEMFAETDITNASMVVDSRAAGKMESIKGMFKGSKVTKGKDLNTFSIARYADYMYQNTPITSVGDLNSSTVISLEGIFDNCMQLQTATVDLTEENYSQRYPLNKNANWKFAFRNCSALTKVPNLWDIYKGESEDCFKGCGNASNFNDVPLAWGGIPDLITKTFNTIEEWNTAKADPNFGDNIQNEIHVFGFNDNITYPDNILYTPYQIQGRTKFSSMFRFNSAPKGLIISSELFTKLPNLSEEETQYNFTYTFEHSTIKSIPDKFISIPNIEKNFTVSLSNMFYDTDIISQKEINAHNIININNNNENITLNFSETFKNIDGVDKINLIYDNNITVNCQRFITASYNIKEILVRLNKTNNINAICESCSNLLKANIEINSNVNTYIDCTNIFSGCKSLKEDCRVYFNFDNFSNLRLSNMFSFCYNIETLDTNIFDKFNQYSNKIEVSNMFNQCLKLKHIPEIWTLETEYYLHDAFAKYCIEADNFEEVPESYGGPRMIEYTSRKDFINDLLSSKIVQNSIITFNINHPTNYVSFGSADGSTEFNSTIPIYIKSGPNNSVEFYGIVDGSSSKNVIYNNWNINFYKKYKFTYSINLFSYMKKAYSSTLPITELDLNITTNENFKDGEYYLIKFYELTYSSTDDINNINKVNLIQDREDMYKKTFYNFGWMFTRSYINGEISIDFNKVNGLDPNPSLYINFQNMFSDSSYITSIPNLFTNVPKFNNIGGKCKASQMFSGCSNLKYVDEKFFDKLPKDIPIYDMFKGCSKLQHIPPLWEKGFTGQHNGFATGCTSADNYNEVPEGWK